MTRTEAQTRSELIDSRLVQSGWNVKDPTHVIEEFDILTPLHQEVAEPCTPYGGHQFSDYVLLCKDRKLLAVVEAKKTSKDAALGREQAKQYCYNIQKQQGFIIEREKVEKKDLINAPFTVIHPQGIRGVFSPAEINEILQLTERLEA
jgi:type I site-specific restriction endonuclease